MEGISQECPFVRRIADALQQERFTLIDVGCSGGIDPGWRLFGGKLRAFGFDATVEECARLSAQETHSGIRYVAAFAGLRPDHPFAKKKAGKPHWDSDPWRRLSIARTLEIRQKEIEGLSSEEKLKLNQWQQTRLADPGQPIYLPEFLAENHTSDVDFIKLDVDGPDFEILHSLEDVLGDARVLGVGMEVIFAGSDSETDHTFHNTDRFMRSKGFDLYYLTVRRYSAAALPSRYLWGMPTQTELGRPRDGDALYVRDLCNPERADFASSLSPEKILKTAAIFAVFNLPDCAAEVLIKFRAKIASLCDVDSLLDTLAAQIQPGGRPALSYKDYMAAFERDEDWFYGPKPAPPAPRSRLRRILGI